MEDVEGMERLRTSNLKRLEDKRCVVYLIMDFYISKEYHRPLNYLTKILYHIVWDQIELFLGNILILIKVINVLYHQVL